MKSFKMLLAFLSFSVFFTPTVARAYRVTTVETHYVEPDYSLDTWLVVLLSATLLCWFSEQIAPKYVQSQEDIDSYRITVKVKRRHKTVDEATFAGPDFEDVIEEALDFAQSEYEDGYSFVFKPAILVRGRRNAQDLEILTIKTRLHSSSCWKEASRDLTRRFLVPEKPRTVYVSQPTRVVEHVTVVHEQPRWSSFWVF